MDDFRNVWVSLKVTEWVQAITNSGDSEEAFSDPPGMRLRANCVIDARSSSFRLSSNEDFSKLWVEMDLVEGPALMGSGKPVEKGIGIFDYGKAVERIPSGIYCYIGFEPEHYKEIWAQVRSGAYSLSTIHLDVGPLALPKTPLGDLVWEVGSERPRLFVFGATVRFWYRPASDPQERPR
jgi:hypothetical protein